MDDEASEALMNAVFRRWLDGAEKAEALRQAQEAVRADPRWSSPRYWAAFQLTGAR